MLVLCYGRTTQTTVVISVYNMNECFRPWFCSVTLYLIETTLANEIKFGVNPAPGVGSIVRPVDLQFSVLALRHNKEREVMETA